MATPEENAIINLTTQTTALLNAVSASAAATEARISAAVIVSENASQIPLAQMAVVIINTNTRQINQLTGGS
jgi:hypothetical protein